MIPCGNNSHDMIFRIDSKLWTSRQPNVYKIKQRERERERRNRAEWTKDEHFLFIIQLLDRRPSSIRPPLSLPFLIHNWNIAFMADYTLNNIRLQTSVLIIRSLSPNKNGSNATQKNYWLQCRSSLWNESFVTQLIASRLDSGLNEKTALIHIFTMKIHITFKWLQISGQK